MRHTVSEPVAIIGMGCILPGAAGPAQLWDNLKAGNSAVTTIAGPRSDWSAYLDADSETGEHANSLLGASVVGLEFDWRRYRTPPIEVRSLHRAEMMVMEAAAQAMTSAGFGAGDLPSPDRVAVILGAAGFGRKSELTFNAKWQLPILMKQMQETDAWNELPPDKGQALASAFREHFIQTHLANSDDWAFWSNLSLAAARVCQYFNLRGPHFCVDAHSASGLAALEFAVAGLHSRRWDMALVGAVSPTLSPTELVLHSKLRRLSAHGVFPFDVRADGTVLGEGAVQFLLKRLSDAERDGDTILAAIRGVAGVNYGRGSVLVSTDCRAHEEASREALQRAGVEPETVSYIETGATGLPAWDAEILRGLGSTYAGDKPILLGAVSEAVGDLQAASDLTALLKVVLSLQHRIILPQATFRKLHPLLDNTSPALAVSKGAECGPGPTRAAVHAAGFGGIAYHAVIEEYVPTGRERRLQVVAPTRQEEPIAVVGMACLVPGAQNVAEFWSNSLQNSSQRRVIPDDRWPVSLYYTPEYDRNVDPFKVNSRWAGLVDDSHLPGREPSIPPETMRQMDRTQRWTLAVARDALRDAGLGDGLKPVPKRTAVILGGTPGNDREVAAETLVSFREIDRTYAEVLGKANLPAELADQLREQLRKRFLSNLPPLTSDTFPGMLSSGCATRVARAFDLAGPALTVESACASSLIAVQLCMDGLRAGRWDLAMAGGVWSQITPAFCVSMSFIGISSPTGAIRPFARDADGYFHGEGCGVVVLKRLEDALRDGDRVYAVLRGAASSSDGRGRSLFFSVAEGQQRAMQLALEESQVAPASVQYVEVHGTGMPEGDLAEIEALAGAYGGRDQPLAVGAVKPVIGHMYTAAGTASLIRAVMALYNKVIPPVWTSADQIVQANASDLELNRTAKPWPKGRQPRRAAVNAYGFGGSNVHLVLEEFEE